MNSATPRPFSDGTPPILRRFSQAFEHRGGRDLVVLIDGLGSTALAHYRGYARTLSALAQTGETTRSLVPSTTAAALASYFTGLSPLEHGVLGYTTLNADGVAINQITGAPGIRGETWRGGRTLGEAALKRGRALAHVGPERYRGSFMTAMLQPGWGFFGYARDAERDGAVAAALRSVGPDGLVYLHVPDLDKAGHAHGPGSNEWLNALEDVDALVRGLIRMSPPKTRLLITSDHGMIRAVHDSILDLADSPLAGDVAAVAGEGRALMVRMIPESGQDRWDQLRDWVGGQGTVILRSEMLTNGILGPADATTHHPDLGDRLGDALILARGSFQFTDTRWISRQALAQRGVHGSVSEDETVIPVLSVVA